MSAHSTESNEITSTNPKRVFICKIVERFCLLAMAIGLVLVLQLFWTARSARNCVQQLQTLVPGRSQQREVEKMLRPTLLGTNVTKQCTSGNCAFLFNFESWVSRMHIARTSQFQAYVLSENGVVSDIHLYYVGGDSMLVSFGETPRTGQSQPDAKMGYMVSVRDARRGSLLNLQLRTDSPLPTRRVLVNLNMGCLKEIIGCRSAAEVIPDLQSLHFRDAS